MINIRTERLQNVSRRIVLPDWNYDDEGVYCLVYCIVNCLKYYRAVKFPNLNWDDKFFPLDIKSKSWTMLIEDLKKRCNPQVGLSEEDFKKTLKELDSSIPLSIKREKFTEQTLNYCLSNKLPPILIYDLGILYPRTEINMLSSHAGVFLGKKRPNIYLLYDPFWNQEYREYLQHIFNRAWQKRSFKGYVFKVKRRVHKKPTKGKKTLFDFE